MALHGGPLPLALFACQWIPVTHCPNRTVYISFRVAIAFHHGAGLFPSTVSKVGDQGAVESRCFGLGCGVLDGEGDKGTSRTRTDDLPIQEGTTDQRGPEEKPQPDCNVDDRE